MAKNNPYANKNGRPKLGKFSEFLEWEREQELNKRKVLTKEALECLEAAEKNLSNKMRS